MIKSKKLISIIIIISFSLIIISSINENTYSQTPLNSLKLVAIGNSTPAGYGIEPQENYLRIYAEYIKQDLGLEVEIINWAENGNKNLLDWIKAVTTDEVFRMDIKNANIITIWLNWYEGMPYIYKTERVYKDELNMTNKKMGDSYNILFAEITRLVDPKETLIVVAETGIPPAIAETWKDNNFYQELKQYAYEDWKNYLRKAAENNNVKVVPTYKAFNGQDGNSMLPEVYIQKDGIHFSAKGHKLIADLHRNLGYNPLR